MKADWTACSPRRIQLCFQEAGASRLRISDALEALIAPALLPRTWLTQQALLALREVGTCSSWLSQTFPFEARHPRAAALQTSLVLQPSSLLWGPCRALFPV